MEVLISGARSDRSFPTSREGWDVSFQIFGSWMKEERKSFI